MSSPYQVTHFDSLERGLAWLLEKYGGYTFSQKKVFKLKVDSLEQVAMSYKAIIPNLLSLIRSDFKLAQIVYTIQTINQIQPRSE